MKGISLMGAHRTGKTTLAKAYAEKHGIKFIDMSVAPAYAACRYPMGMLNKFDERMRVQDAALDMYTLNLLEQKGAPFITDRCFLDLAAYTLADYPQNPTLEQANWFQSYSKKCISLNAKWFNTVVFIRPGLDLVEDTTSWSNDVGVVAKVDACMLWTCGCAVKVNTMPVYITEHEMRLAHLEVLINESKI